MAVLDRAEVCAGVYPEQWPLPLNLAAVQQAQTSSQMQVATAATQGLSTTGVEPSQHEGLLTRKRSSASTSGDGAMVCFVLKHASESLLCFAFSDGAPSINVSGFRMKYNICRPLQSVPGILQLLLKLQGQGRFLRYPHCKACVQACKD